MSKVCVLLVNMLVLKDFRFKIVPRTKSTFGTSDVQFLIHALEIRIQTIIFIGQRA